MHSIGCSVVFVRLCLSAMFSVVFPVGVYVSMKLGGQGLGEARGPWRPAGEGGTSAHAHGGVSVDMTPIFRKQ